MVPEPVGARAEVKDPLSGRAADRLTPLEVGRGDVAFVPLVGTTDGSVALPDGMVPELVGVGIVEDRDDTVALDGRLDEVPTGAVRETDDVTFPDATDAERVTLAGSVVAVAFDSDVGSGTVGRVTLEEMGNAKYFEHHQKQKNFFGILHGFAGGSVELETDNERFKIPLALVVKANLDITSQLSVDDAKE